MAVGDLQIRPIRSEDRLTGLSLGDAKFTALKTFVQRHAKSYEAQSLARTYGGYVEEAAGIRFRGYITLVSGEVDIGNDVAAQPEGVDYRYKHYPAVKIARLAVDEAVRRRDVGRSLVDFAVGVALEYICPRIGCRFIVVDSKPESVGFYQRCGFTLIDTDENRQRDEPILFMDLHKLNSVAVA